MGIWDVEWMKRDSIVNLLGQLSLVITVFLLEDFFKSRKISINLISHTDQCLTSYLQLMVRTKISI